MEATGSPSFLKERGDDRLALYKRLLKLYDDRSLGVHGGAINTDRLLDHVDEVRSILASALIKTIEAGHALTNDELQALFR